jgi:hypothetical protein
MYLYGEWRAVRRNQHEGLDVCIQFLLEEWSRPESKQVIKGAPSIKSSFLPLEV